MANQYRLITILSTAKGEEGIASLTDTIKAKIESGATIDTFDGDQIALTGINIK